TFDFVINTTGDGLQFHDSIQTDDKEKVHVELVFKNIPYDRLFFTPIGGAPSFLFFEYLLYPCIVVQDAPFKASFIYKYLLHEFYEFYDTQKYSLNTFQKPQGDDNCPWKILIKHLSIHLPDNVYQRVRFLGDRDLLLQFYKEGDACGDIEAQNIFLICIEKFHARIAAALKIGAISREEGEEAQALATFIQQQVKTYNPMTPVITDIETPIEVIPDKDYAANCAKSLRYFKVDFPVPYGYSVKDPEDTEIPCTPETLVTGLQRVRKYSLQWPLEEGVKLYVIERFIDQIPILDEAFWEKVPECTHEKCLEILSEVMEFYHHKTLLTHGYISGKQVDHLLTLYTAIDRLARKIEAKRQNILERFSPFNPLPFLDNEPFLHLSHARETSRYQEARLYFEGYNQSFSIPRLDTVRTITDLNVQKNNFSHFCYEVAKHYSSVQLKCKNGYCNNLRSMSFQRNATNDLINTYLLIKNRARYFTPETDHLKQWVDAIWRMQTLLSDGPKIESQSVNLNPCESYIDRSWSGFIFKYTKWKKNERYQQYFQPPEEDLRTFFEKRYHKRMFFAKDPRPHEVKTLG
ncbi:MAG: hypothetical protein KDK69_02980, partial [Chlamydiia bacterium]|nr:hypothetical protein [Chlamydiia bacterium]